MLLLNNVDNLDGTMGFHGTDESSGDGRHGRKMTDDQVLIPKIFVSMTMRVPRDLPWDFG